MSSPIPRGHRSAPYPRFADISPPRTAAAAQPEPLSRVTPASGLPRLPNGAIRDLVLTHLTRFADHDFSPTELSRALGRPSSRGAVINACRRLVADGAAVRTCQHPQRFQATPEPTPPAGAAPAATRPASSAARTAATKVAPC
jgi:hypothetical protein